MLFVFIPTTNIYSQNNNTHNNSSALLISSISESELSSNPNSEMLENQGLYAVYQQSEMEITKIMEIAHQSMNLTNSFRNFPLVNLTPDMQQQLRGVPSDQDVEKRNKAKSLLANDTYVLLIGMNLPNGDTYFSEPYYPSQANSSVYNYAYRDHIIGAQESRQPYLSNVINATSAGKPIVVLSTPIFSDKAINSTLAGMLALALYFTLMK